ncbi:hypothetical protein F5884DRAFT_758410 [Xylogone sp. PMI_703]|nr:hypothetical protein F5884DRAFT_758410 [Xylogone sp. PMI_703]
MSQFGIPHRLKRIKAKLPMTLRDSSEEVTKSSTDSRSGTVAVTPGTTHRFLRILLGQPWDDYDYIHHLGQEILASRKASYFKLVNIRQCQSSHVLEQRQILSSIQHPNIAAVYDVYCNNDETFLVMEHLGISLSQLEFQKYELEEWEIATITAEVPISPRMAMPCLQSQVLKGVTYISSLELSCKHLSMANIRFSLAGEIKLVLDFQTLYHDHLYEGSKTSQVLLDFPILAELIEEMILTRYHLTPDDEKWSEDALSFLSCTLSGSLESLVNVRDDWSPNTNIATNQTSIISFVLLCLQGD